MKVTLLTTKYSESRANAWLTNELAYSIHEKGHQVTAIVFSWLGEDPPSSVKVIDDVTVIRVKLHRFFYQTGAFGTALKVFLFPYWARLFIRRHLKGCDLLVANTPCITITGMARFFKKKYSSKAYLVLWDFFPFYLKDLGAIRNRVFFKIFHKIEAKMYRSFDRIGCMTTGNVGFLLKNYKKIDRAKVEVLPLWTTLQPRVVVDKDNVRKRFQLPVDKTVVIYGGAMSIVQELDNLLDLAHECLDENIVFLMVGKGTEKKRLQENAKRRNLTNVIFFDYVPRADYESIVAACDIGLISLSRKLSVPSFPSKSIDYFKVGLPILASLDPVTDFGKILEDEIKAGFSVSAGNTALLRQKLMVLVHDASLRQEFGEAGRSFYERWLSVESARDKILSIVN